MIYFTSDLHFNHERIIDLCNRPFANAKKMKEVLIQNWNKTINKNDEVYILGDFGFFNNIEELNNLLDSLNGRKYLIRGNHDTFIKNKEEINVEWIKDYYKLNFEKTAFILSHYPFYSWEKQYHGSIMLHGHIHSNNIEKTQLAFLGNIYDVGVDANSFTPISIYEIMNKIKERNKE